MIKNIKHKCSVFALTLYIRYILAMDKLEEWVKYSINKYKK